MPLVSVFLPTYNHAPYIRAAIESALAQDYAPLEIVIGDDASTDVTWEVIDACRREFGESRIRAFRNPHNLGITANANRILAQCRGQFIVFFSGDDLLLPGKIAKQIAPMRRDPQVVLSYHDVSVFASASGCEIRRWNSGPLGERPITGSCGKLAHKLVQCGTSFLCALSVVARRDALPPDGFDARVQAASDWLLWIEICANARGRVEYVPEVLARHRRHDTNVTLQSDMFTHDWELTLAIVEEKYPALRRSAAICRARRLHSDGIARVLRGDHKGGRRDILQALLAGSGQWKAVPWLLHSVGVESGWLAPRAQHDPRGKVGQ
ncbi:MAG: glycosyltransferase [Burkholderiaceae bacterium]|nr:glycosyltransferase [Burkholderiaceae bacterium]